MRPLTYFVAVSQDGYIAGPAGQVDCFEQGPAVIDFLAEHYPDTLPTPLRAHLGIDLPPQRFDTVLMGRATYQVGVDQGVTSPYAHMDRQIVVSSTLAGTIDPAVEVVTDPVAAIADLKASARLGVWLCGGGVLAGALIDEIDELVVKRQPLAFGAGCAMFSGAYRPTAFELVDHQVVGPITVDRLRRLSPDHLR